jgi:uncharacterized membrane protein YbhN (UPF0104 family)
MIAHEQTVPELSLPTVDVRAVARRAAVPVLLVGVALAAALLAGGRIQALADGLRRGLDVSPGWALLGALLECVSLLGYVGLLALVAGRATPRVRVRESAQIALAGAAATRLLPTAGAGGVALAVWSLRRAGLGARASARTLLSFLVVLYSVFLLAIIVAGAVLALGLAGGHGPRELGVAPALAASLAIALCLLFASRRDAEADVAGNQSSGRGLRGRTLVAAGLIGAAVRDAWALVRGGDPRLAGAIAYWAFDAAVLWAMLHAVGAAPVLPVVALAYLVGQVANTVPIPGSVSGGMAGVLIAFGVPAEIALPAVLGYRAIAVWLPLPVALASLPALRATIARWSSEDGAALAA